MRTAALVHEVEGTRLCARVRRLAEAGLGRSRLLNAGGGGGVDPVTYFTVVVEVDAADSDQAQSWHRIVYVKDRLQP